MVTVRLSGAVRSENVGISSEMEVRILYTECPRFPTQRSSTWGKAALRRGWCNAGVVDGSQVDIPVLTCGRY